MLHSSLLLFLLPSSSTRLPAPPLEARLVGGATGREVSLRHHGHRPALVQAAAQKLNQRGQRTRRNDSRCNVAVFAMLRIPSAPTPPVPETNKPACCVRNNQAG
jgi:hypothetical protein